MDAFDGFIETVLDCGAAYYRDLPWRNIDDPYAVLVSEIMLQQTQVSRVLGRWGDWMRRYPTVDALCAADTADVLSAWQGLGYNRRALALKRACEQCARDFAGCVPCTVEDLQTLPGIGPATAAGVVAFACNEWSIYVETNVRAVFIADLFRECESVSDREIRDALAICCGRLASRTCDRSVTPRTWYYALLDYGAYLKTTMPNPNHRSAHYTRQSAFEGSRRQKRAELLRFVLAEESCTLASACDYLAEFERSRGRREPEERLVEEILDALAREGFFRKAGDSWVL